MAGSSIGMMDAAFFVGRRAILEWLNSSFLMNRERRARQHRRAARTPAHRRPAPSPHPPALRPPAVSKIEETASGAVACQILDSIWPGELPMGRVRWDAKSPHEYIENYKLLQAMLEKKGVDKHIEVRRRAAQPPVLSLSLARERERARSGLTPPRARPSLRRSLAPPQVDKLMRAKYQDNLENMQWRVCRVRARARAIGRARDASGSRRPLALALAALAPALAPAARAGSRASSRRTTADSKYTRGAPHSRPQRRCR